MHKKDTKQKVKPRLAAQFEEQPVWHGNWVNYNVHSCSAGLGEMIHFSKDAALARQKAAMEEPQPLINMRPKSTHIFTIQLPVIE